MCGIIAGIAKDNIVPYLLEGLGRLEYRGYDSAGINILDSKGDFTIEKTIQKVSSLEKQVNNKNISGAVGMAHTRWATHGKPSIKNAHPHIANTVSVVHNGIIENYQELKKNQTNYKFNSDTDTEVLGYQIYSHFKKNKNLLKAVQKTNTELQGSYAFTVISKNNNELIVSSKNVPVILGISPMGIFIASDLVALLDITDNFVFLQNGDTAQINILGYKIYNENGNLIKRKEVFYKSYNQTLDKGKYKHYMLKEIFEQPDAIKKTLLGRIDSKGITDNAFSNKNITKLKKIKQIQILACGTSYHAGLVAKYWFEDFLGISTQVEVASEYRYRNPVLFDYTLVIYISQSGETADTLACLYAIKKRNKKVINLVISNVLNSSLIRDADIPFYTYAGIEVSVASTKAFTTQLVSLLLLLLSLAKAKSINFKEKTHIIDGLLKLPDIVKKVLANSNKIEKLASFFVKRKHALFLGRGVEYPVALEGALKLKEVSYIHAEAYPAGELKHGPLALIDENMPVIVIAPNNSLLKKLKSNLEEVKARGGELFIFADTITEKSYTDIKDNELFHLITISDIPYLSPITFSIALQLLSYHIAYILGRDIDQPRNLAKSVTVE